jgi:hypothetical protein
MQLRGMAFAAFPRRQLRRSMRLGVLPLQERPTLPFCGLCKSVVSVTPSAWSTTRVLARGRAVPVSRMHRWSSIKLAMADRVAAASTYRRFLLALSLHLPRAAQVGSVPDWACRRNQGKGGGR